MASFTVSLSPTTTAGPFVYSINTPIYSGGGVDLGNFAFSTTAGLHAHTGTAFFAGFNQVGPSSFQAVAIIDLAPEPGHSASYGSQSKNLSFTGGDLVPFLEPSDIVISAGTIGSSTVGSHSHTIAPFSVTVSSSTGPWTWQFASSTAPFAGAHQLTLDPRFDTVATFNYTPFSTAPSEVPEPASLVLFGLGGLGLFSFRRRQRLRNLGCRGA